MKKTLKAALLALILSASAQAQSLKIAYVDLEKVQENYGLQVELEDELQAKYKSIQAELAAKQKSIESTAATLKKNIEAKGNAIQTKMKKTPATGGYKTEAEYNKDMNAVAKMQEDAQTKLDKLQEEYVNLEAKRTQEYQTRQAAHLQTVSDSITSFIKEYNAEKGYDYILIKSTTLFANPSFEITDEVISGLNKKYQEGKNPKPATSTEAPAAATTTEEPVVGSVEGNNPS